ncbi:hypothetical protein GCM10028818_00850 [Spirosoma horti]
MSTSKSANKKSSWLKISIITVVSIFALLIVAGLLAPAKPKLEQVSRKAETKNGGEAPGASVNVVHGGKVYDWASLPASIKTQVGNFHLYYNGGWATPRNSTEFKKEDGFYVKALIDNKMLAELSQSNAFKPEEVLAEKPIFLYGKYKNRWTFQDQGGNEISETEKFDGFDTIEVVREGQTDTVWIGPIPNKPVQMTILLRGDDLDTKPVFSLK